jgi:hypothetical protein
MTKKNIPLIVGLAMPVAMTLFFAASVYIPQFFHRPRHDFVYVPNNGYAQNYSIRDGKLIKEAPPAPSCRRMQTACGCMTSPKTTAAR